MNRCANSSRLQLRSSSDVSGGPSSSAGADNTGTVDDGTGTHLEASVSGVDMARLVALAQYSHHQATSDAAGAQYLGLLRL